MRRTAERIFSRDRIWITVLATNRAHGFEFILLDESEPGLRTWHVWYQDEPDEAGVDLGFAIQKGPHDLARAALLIAREADKAGA